MSARAFGLRDKTVLVTRHADDAREFTDALQALGARVLLAPLIDFEPPGDEAAAAKAVSETAHYRWIAFTSVHGVDAFSQLRRTLAARAGPLEKTAFAAVGPRTAGRLRRHGLPVDYEPKRFTGADLARGLLERSRPGERILLFRAEDAGAELPLYLRAEGRRVDDVAGYRTRAIIDPDISRKARACDIWTFASPSAVRAFVAQLGEPALLANAPLVACVGSVTAGAARTLGLRVDVVPDHFTLEALLAALAAWT